MNEAAHHPWIVRAAPPAFPSFFLSNPHCLSSLATGAATAVTPSTLYDLTSSSCLLCPSHSCCCLHCAAAHQSHLCPCEWPSTAPTTTTGCSALARWLALTGNNGDIACQENLLPASAAASSSSACPHHSCSCGCEPPPLWRPSCGCADTCNSSIANTSPSTACGCRGSRRRPSSSAKSGTATAADKTDKILVRHHQVGFIDSHRIAAEVSSNCEKHFGKSAGAACEGTASIEMMQDSLHRTALSESWEEGVGGKDHHHMSPVSRAIVEPLPPPRSQQLGSDFLGCTPVPAAGDMTRLSSPTSKSRQERGVGHRESRSERRKNRCGNTFSNSSSHGARSIASSEDSDFLSTDAFASSGLQVTRQHQHVSRGECVGASFFSTSDARSVGGTAGGSTCFPGDSEHRVVTRREYEQSIGRGGKQQPQLQHLAASSLAQCKPGPPREDAWMDE